MVQTKGRLSRKTPTNSPRARAQATERVPPLSKGDDDGIRVAALPNVRTLDRLPDLHEVGARLIHADSPRVSTGVPRLDELLGGGLPGGSATLLYGPPFTGKELLARRFAARALADGAPMLAVLSDVGAAEFAGRMAFLEPDLGGDAAQRTRYVDAYSRIVGGDDHHPNTAYVDGLTPIAALFDTIRKQMVALAGPDAKGVRVLIESVSTLVLEAGAQEVFRNLRVLCGQIRRVGGTAVLLLDEGMHSESDVETLKHLCTGLIQTRKQDEAFALHIEGLSTAYAIDWIDYTFDDPGFEITGSFASERIRSVHLV